MQNKLALKEKNNLSGNYNTPFNGNTAGEMFEWKLDQLPAVDSVRYFLSQKGYKKLIHWNRRRFDLLTFRCAE